MWSDFHDSVIGPGPSTARAVASRGCTGPPPGCAVERAPLRVAEGLDDAEAQHPPTDRRVATGRFGNIARCHAWAKGWTKPRLCWTKTGSNSGLAHLAVLS